MADKMKRKKAAIQKELNNIRKQEEKLEQSVQNWEEPQWKETLEKKIPSRTLQTLEQVIWKGIFKLFLIKELLCWKKAIISSPLEKILK